MENRLADSAYAGLRAKLMAGAYMPGDLLSENELAAELGMSRTPVRAAVTRLAAEGFLTILKNRGALVADISGKAVLDDFELVFALVAYVGRQMETGEAVPDLSELRLLMNTQEEAEARNDYAGYMTASMAFLGRLVGTLDNGAMEATMAVCLDRMHRASMVHYRQTPDRLHYTGIAMNRQLLEAAAAGDGARLSALSRSLYDGIRERALRYASY